LGGYRLPDVCKFGCLLYHFGETTKGKHSIKKLTKKDFLKGPKGYQKKHSKERFLEKNSQRRIFLKAQKGIKKNIQRSAFLSVFLASSASIVNLFPPKNWVKAKLFSPFKPIVLPNRRISLEGYVKDL